MHRLRWIAAAALALSACGESYCEKAASDAEACGESVSDTDIEQCEEALDSCSGEDKDLLDDFYDCAQDAGLLACEDTESTATGSSGTEDLAALFACIGPLMSLSQECQDSGFSFGFGGSSTYTYTTTSGSR